MLRSSYSASNKPVEITKVDAICDFLEVYIHCILYYRSAYPKTLFEDRTAYGILVKSSRHPELNQYILDAVSAVRTQLAKGGAACDVMIEIIDGQSRPVESFVLEISTVAGLYESRHDVDLRAALTRVSTLEPGPRLSEVLLDSSFQVCFRRRSGDAPTLEKNLWIPRLSDARIDNKVFQDGSCVESAPVETRRLVPLGAVDDQELKIQAMALLRRC